jgi:hypothetical protein
MLSGLACVFNGTHNKIDLDWIASGQSKGSHAGAQPTVSYSLQFVSLVSARARIRYQHIGSHMRVRT